MELNQLISVNFNLRKPKSTTPTPLYMVVYYWDDKGMKVQAKVPTGRKVHPSLWDSRKQQPIMVNKGIDLTDKQLSEQADLYQYIAQVRILALSNTFTTFAELKENINLTDNDMSVTPQFIQSKKTPKATKMIEEVLTMWEQQGGKSKNTINTYRVDYKKWCKWLVSTNQTDSAKALSQVAFNSFKDWMLNNGESAQNINTKCSTIARIIKELVNGKGAKYGVKEVTFKTLAVINKKVKCELLKEELEALKQVATQTEKETFSRNVFLLQLATGQRVSNAYTLIKGEYEVLKDGNGNGNEFIIIKNKKGTTATNDKKSYIPMTKEVSDLLQTLKGSELLPKNGDALKNLVNRNIKVLAERAGLDRITENGKPLFEEISNHYARHTQATRLARNGMTSEQIALQLGNSTEMVERVYTHATDSDIIAKLQPAPQVAAGNTPAPQVQTVQPAQQESKLIEATKNIGGYDVTLQANGGSDFDNYFINKELNNKLARLKELRESNVMSEGVFDYSLQYISKRNDLIKVYNELCKKVLVKLNYPTQAIESKSSEELINTLYLMRGDLLQYVPKSKVKTLFSSTKDKTKEVDDLLNKIGVFTDILEA
ncbi:tyrosine-type recombinase/integrase [Prevotella melaninogenica]|uniref:tyrosine-type recombinase/integrase n=1 Tax=Prevotella melaninogenica TaxID=28132 RepID=UPI001D148CCC|nr:tyrosine-type recombinase/integrase [Prevotella melaninogenica]UEB00328.1 tyrosine-type recombinase/integrase [Prevotella melaninogenica]